MKRAPRDNPIGLIEAQIDHPTQAWVICGVGQSFALVMGYYDGIYGKWLLAFDTADAATSEAIAIGNAAMVTRPSFLEFDIDALNDLDALHLIIKDLEGVQGVVFRDKQGRTIRSIYMPGSPPKGENDASNKPQGRQGRP